ncbi:DUF6301 family protein [Leucobacter sp. NPDC058333]|uniref:DUF6301 family protein n=1 Tax=Leucobacter sp. NPDC058333 TaxID=3346450 RepID=UPI00365A9B82
MNWKAMAPADVCDIIDFWIGEAWPMSKGDAQQRAVQRFGWITEDENQETYLVNSVSSLSNADVMMIELKDQLMDCGLDVTDTIRDVTDNSLAFLGDAFTLIVREGKSRWGVPQLQDDGEVATARWEVTQTARVTVTRALRGVSVTYDTPQGAALARKMERYE